ncbi:hypothetical protein ACXJY6_12020 [Vibrio sp. RC27]
MNPKGTTLAITMLASSMSSASTYEIVSTKFIDGIEYHEQKLAMETLNSVVQRFEGFQSRRYFYSEELNRWTDIVVWENANLAQAASMQAMENAKAQKVFSKMDIESSIFSHYQAVGQLGAK